MSSNWRNHEERHANFQAPDFMALSADVLINVINFLPPCDIISIRQTCKTLLSLTKLRTVWMNALRWVMQDLLITEDTFPLESMSLPMLEHAALSPHRFVSLMERSDNRTLEATSIRVLPYRLTNQEKILHGISHSGVLRDMIMAPGGRYLVTIARCDELSSLLTVWDLGLSGNDGIKALTRFHQPVLHLSVVNFFPDLEKRGIFYLVTTRIDHALQGDILIVDVHTLTISPPIHAFTSVTKIEIPNVGEIDSDVFVIPTLYRVAMHMTDSHRTCFFIWDFIHNRAVTWTAPDCRDGRVSKFFNYDDSLVVALKDKILIYNIPPLSPYDSDSEIAPPPHEPCISLSGLLPTNDSHYVSQHSWPVSQVPQYICVVDHDNDQVIVHEIKSTLTGHDSTIPNKLPIFAGRAKPSDDGPSFEDINFYHLEQSDGHLFLGSLSTEREDFAVSMFKVVNPPEKERDLKLVKAYLCPDPTVAVVCQQICPSMGRVCLVTRETRELHILDYLVPPAT